MDRYDFGEGGMMIKRYYAFGRGQNVEAREHEMGAYVLYADYAFLLEQNNILRGMLKECGIRDAHIDKYLRQPRANDAQPLDNR